MQLMLAPAAAHSLTHAAATVIWFFQDQQAAVGFDIISLWRQMGIVARGVVIILFIMSGWSIGVMIDRAMAYSAARKQSRAFAPAVAGALRDGRIDEAIKVAERNKKSHLAKVVTAGLMEFRAHQDSGEIPGEIIEASKRALERTEAIVHAELKRGLGGLATIGSTAPFVGLFGTVFGILNAFREIASSKTTGLGAVAGGISEALVGRGSNL
jgi:biopolymer transport protein ExbB